ncbi:carboxylesterase/lipase family protein [Streptomyces sp. NPDC058470]|uniref:carboxylesterase/lipase family protein n=1 Tax=Streptomyces sp. NPDC058470 TaxID=3346515 RepID=UPI00364EC33A
MRTVRVEQGSVTGKEIGEVHAFLGLPYAAPPVGALRWRPPAPPAPWSGVRAATAFGAAAIQTAGNGRGPGLGAEQSEDCLYLNVWTPEADGAANLPVMVWIHGGGFIGGSASDPSFSGETLARRGVVVVSLNYRLGAFGFLTDPRTGTNFAVGDWVAALTWVADNITAFGGDPGNVTVFGQSAGAVAVRTLLSTPFARGLFHRGIIQSAGFEDYAVVAPPSYERAARATEEVFGFLGSQDPDELRQLSAERVREASWAMAGTTAPADQLHTPANLVWYPTVDGEVVTRDFSNWPANLPVMLGSTQDEARFFQRPDGLHGRRGLDPAEVYTPLTLAAMADRLGGSRADDILAHFDGSGLTTYEALAELSTSAVWHEPELASYERFAALGRTCYSYRFARVSPSARRSGLLAFHTAELPYLFRRIAPGEEYDETDAGIGDVMRHAWTEFARTGVPRGPDGGAWPAWDTSAPRQTLIADTVRSGTLHVGPVTELIHSLRKTPAEVTFADSPDVHPQA